jgi:3-phosphoshikimate 1-carboxyvinyltransferase
LSQATATRVIAPARNVLGSLRLPGDKSISHRYALLGGLAHGTTHLENFSTGADPASSLACVAALGAAVERNGASITIQGCGGRFQPCNTALDCGNSGSTMRMLAGLLAGQHNTPPTPFTLIGDSSLSRRPMERIRKPLEAMGARITLTDSHAPLTIEGAALMAIDYTTPVPSAQVKTAVLFAGLNANGTTTVTESVRTRDHGEIALEAFGVKVTRRLDTVSITGGQPLQGVSTVIPGDISSAAFFLCAAALFPDSGLLLDNLGLNPTRASLLDVLAMLGAKTSVLNLEQRSGELAGTVQLVASKDGLTGATISGALAAQLIDELPVLAAIAPYTRNGIRIRDAKELRVKESDRIALVAENLRRMGAEVTEVEDGMDVPGGQALHGAEIDSGGDHRIAMAFSVAALRADGESMIHGAESADISFPEFFSLLDQVAVR